MVKLLCGLAFTANAFVGVHAQTAAEPATPAGSAAPASAANSAGSAPMAPAPRGQGGFGSGRGFGGAGFRGGPAGPPAPVPPAVAMQKPTLDELGKINDALQKFIGSDASGVKPLLEKYPGLIVLQSPNTRGNTAIVPTTNTPRYGRRHDAFVPIAQKGDIDLLLEGDSITDWWISMNGTPTDAYTKYFGGIKTADFAVAGDTTQGVLWGLQNGEGQGFQPKAVMLMIGTNNTGSNTAAEIAEGVGADVLELRKDFPNAKILLLGIFPRSDPGDPVRQKIATINQIISKLDDHQHVFYMDIGSKFLDDKGFFLPDAFRSDKLHPQEKGYEIWGEAVKDQLAELLK